MAFNRMTDVLNVHESRDTIPTESASQLKLLFDQDVNTVKTRLNGLMTQLEATTGAGNIGIITLPFSTATDVQGIVEDLAQGVDDNGSSINTLNNSLIALTNRVVDIEDYIENMNIIPQASIAMTGPSIFTYIVNTYGTFVYTTGNSITFRAPSTAVCDSLSIDGGDIKYLRDTSNNKLTPVSGDMIKAYYDGSKFIGTVL